MIHGIAGLQPDLTLYDREDGLMFISSSSDIEKNRLYITLKGTFEEQEAKLAASRIMGEIEKLSPGFDVITDITSIQSSDVEATDELTKVHQILRNSGVNRIVRVVGKQIDQVVGKIQFDIVSKDSGLEAKIVDSVVEAEAYLDNLS